jgi:hypothetical protein
MDLKIYCLVGFAFERSAGVEESSPLFTSENAFSKEQIVNFDLNAQSSHITPISLTVPTVFAPSTESITSLSHSHSHTTTSELTLRDGESTSSLPLLPSSTEASDTTNLSQQKSTLLLERAKSEYNLGVYVLNSVWV